eukprot:TRINITY_DN37242_c0_g1_i8.p8 TRINITY_DN37242_c0_g1~~TRINITY_DN37242_c0_g1_i8.p8  ORF type:complete len:117 (+),score=1.41 TRINITY_DN37242_c0_g1_i8:1727-2077(+)
MRFTVLSVLVDNQYELTQGRSTLGIVLFQALFYDNFFQSMGIIGRIGYLALRFLRVVLLSILLHLLDGYPLYMQVYIFLKFELGYHFMSMQTCLNCSLQQQVCCVLEYMLLRMCCQ